MKSTDFQPGNSADLIAPGGGVLSGVGVSFGTSLLVFPIASAAAGQPFAGITTGIDRFPKANADVFAVGNKVNWDNGAKEFKNAAGDVDNAATIIEAAGNGDDTAILRLTPV